MKVKGIVTPPAMLKGGVIGRVVELKDGSQLVQTWDFQTKIWRAGDAVVGELTGAIPLSPASLKLLGVVAD